MRLRHIEVFHAVYTARSMTQAAQHLNVSQPSVSKVLRHAELQLGFKLFERSHGQLLPTPEGERLFPAVAELFQALGEIRRLATNLREAGEGRIRVASTPALSLQLVPRMVATFMSQFPDIVFELETLHQAEISSALTEARIDVGLAFQPLPATGVKSHPIATRQLVLIAPPDLPLPRSKNLRLDALKKLPFIALHERSPLGHLLQAHLQSADLNLHVVAVAETYHIARSLVSQGIGVAIVDEITATSEPAGAVQVRQLSTPLAFDVCILTPETTPLSRLSQRFCEHLADHFPPAWS